MTFQHVCDIEKIVPGTGVCALVDDKQIAIFRPTSEHKVYALSNTDPFYQSNVLSRGLVCEHQGELWIASPLKKQRFNLASGKCMEDERFSIASFPAQVVDGQVSVSGKPK